MSSVGAALALHVINKANTQIIISFFIIFLLNY